MTSRFKHFLVWVKLEYHVNFCSIFGNGLLKWRVSTQNHVEFLNGRRKFKEKRQPKP